MRKYCYSSLLLVLASLEMRTSSAASESGLTLKVHLSEGEISLRDGDDPCIKVYEHCRESEESDCFYETHATTLDAIFSNWMDVYTNLRISPEFFIDCQPFLQDGEVEEASTSTFQPSSVYALLESVSNANTTRQVIAEVLSLLNRSVQGDQEALELYDKIRYQLKLSDEERLSLYSQAITIHPHHPFVVDQFALALIYTGSEPRGRKLYQNAVNQGMWPHVLHRPVESYYPDLAATAWHDKNEYPLLLQLEEAYLDIKQELLYNLRENKHLFALEAENVNTPKGGQWKELRLKSIDNYTDMEEFFPVTVNLLRNSDQEIINVKFSSIQPGTHIRLHTGPSNKSLRCHLTLIHDGGAQLRVGNDWTSWEEGKAILFDSSWEHEVIHNGNSIRVVLIIDIWHPDLPQEMRI